MKKGNALIEFIIILPILIFIILAVIDYGKVSIIRHDLETFLNDTINLYEDGKNFEEIENFINNNSKYEISLLVENIENKYFTFTLSNDITLITPGANRLFSNPYTIKVSRTLYEKK